MEGSVDRNLNLFKAGFTKAMKRANEIRRTLPLEYSFIKELTEAQVSRSYMMPIPTDFCKKHLPESEAIVILEISGGKSYEVKFLGGKMLFKIKRDGVADQISVLKVVERRLSQDIKGMKATYKEEANAPW